MNRTTNWQHSIGITYLARPAVLALALASTGITTPACSPHKVTHNPAPPFELPTSFHRIAAKGANLPNRWWHDFHDPDLDQLVNTALQENLEVRAAWERLAQASAAASAAGAGLYPSVNLSSNFAQNTLANAFFPTFPLSVDASYEVNLFKQVGNGLGAAKTDEMAARDQVESLAMTLVARIAEAWFALISQRARLVLLNEQIKVSENFLELATMRLGQGLGSSLDLLQQRQQLAAIVGQKPLIESAAETLENQLALLTGKPPGGVQLANTKTLPTLPALPNTGIPADLLLRRPDVRAARLAATAADYRVAVAVANRLPTLRLSARYSPFTIVNNNEFSVNPIWNLAANILAPLFQGGRLKADVNRNKANVREKSYIFGQSLLQAMLEVENALQQERRQVEYVTDLQGQLKIAQQTLEEARSRYAAGFGGQSFIQILTALSSQQQIEQTLLLAKQQALSYRIQLCRALGGNWTRELAARVSTQTPNANPQKHQIAAPSPKGSIHD